MESSIILRPPLRAATIRHLGPYPEIGRAFAQLGSVAESANLIGEGALLIALYHDDPRTVAPGALRSDAGLLVPPGKALPAGLTDTAVAGGRYLHARHVGSYAGLPAVWDALRQQGMLEHGAQRGEGPAYELYLNNPGTAAAEELVTDIYIPVR